MKSKKQSWLDKVDLVEHLPEYREMSQNETLLYVAILTRQLNASDYSQLIDRNWRINEALKNAIKALSFCLMSTWEAFFISYEIQLCKKANRRKHKNLIYNCTITTFPLLSLFSFLLLEQDILFILRCV